MVTLTDTDIVTFACKQRFNVFDRKKKVVAHWSRRKVEDLLCFRIVSPKAYSHQAKRSNNKRQASKKIFVFYWCERAST